MLNLSRKSRHGIDAIYLDIFGTQNLTEFTTDCWANGSGVNNDAAPSATRSESPGLCFFWDCVSLTSSH